MDKTLNKVIKKLTNIGDWYADNKDEILAGDLSDKALVKYHSELLIIGSFLINSASGLLKLANGCSTRYDPVVRDLSSDSYLKRTEDWFEKMLGRKIVWDE